MEKIHLILVLLFIFSSCMVILSKNPVHSVLFLIITFGISSIILLMFDVEFLGLLFLIIYVGAIAILFLFVVMMLSLKSSVGLDFKIIFFIVLSTFFFFISFYAFLNSFFEFKLVTNVAFSGDYTNNLVTFGQVLYNYYLLLFLIAGLILLVAVIGAVVLTLEHKKLNKSVITFRQLSRGKNSVKFGN